MSSTKMKKDNAVAEVEVSSSLWEKCARTLSLNTTADLLDLLDLLQTLCQNIISNQEESKFRTIKLSNKTIQNRLINRKGGLEFLAAVGFLTKIVDGNKILQLDIDESEDNQHVYLDIEDSLAWLNSTADTCIQMSDTNNRQPNETCADCAIHLRLPNGTSVYGGFARTDPLSTVLSFSCCYFHSDRSKGVQLRQAHNASAVVSGEELEMTMLELGLFPRATLIVSTLTDEGRSTSMQQTQHKVADDIKLQKEKAEIVRKEKIRAREVITAEKAKTLLAFKDDRDDSRDKRTK